MGAILSDEKCCVSPMMLIASDVQGSAQSPEARAAEPQKPELS